MIHERRNVSDETVFTPNKTNENYGEHKNMYSIYEYVHRLSITINYFRFYSLLHPFNLFKYGVNSQQRKILTKKNIIEYKYNKSEKNEKKIKTKKIATLYFIKRKVREVKCTD